MLVISNREILIRHKMSILYCGEIQHCPSRFQGWVRGFARYSVHLTATVLPMINPQSWAKKKAQLSIAVGCYLWRFAFCLEIVNFVLKK